MRRNGPPLHSLKAAGAPFSLAVIIACGADTGPKDGTDAIPCEKSPSSPIPCRGLLPKCAPTALPPPGRRIPVAEASSDCPRGTYRALATTAEVHLPPGGLGVSVELRLEEPSCRLFFSLGARVEDWPIWPWLVQGAELELDLWDSGNGNRGGDPLWMSLRDPTTKAMLLTIYQLDDVLIRDGTVAGELGFGVELLGPVCESEEQVEGLLEHEYELRFGTSSGTLALREGKEGLLPTGGGGGALALQTGPARKAFAHLLTTGIYDFTFGSVIHFVAWPEP